MRLIFTIPLLLVFSAVSAQQDSIAARYANMLSTDSLSAYLHILAADSLEGRETGKEGQKKAAAFIADRFEEFGLEQLADSGYFQRYVLIETAIDSAVISGNSQNYRFLEDFYFFAPMVASGEQSIGRLWFGGYGIDDSLYSDYAGMDEHPEGVVIWEGEPEDRDGNHLMTGTGYNTAWSRDFSKKLSAAKKRGVKNLFIVSEDFESMVKRMAFYLTMPRVRLFSKEDEPGLSIFYISEETASSLLGKEYKPERLKQRILKKKKGQSFAVQQDMSIRIEKVQQKITAENVVGLVPGQDQQDEYIVITAHYDHLGKRGEEIYNGADDDGSGTSALIEMARVMAEAHRDGHGPDRSILFLAVSGEEKGLLGSKYYTMNPLVPMDQTVANLNVDMIGRNDDAHEPNSEYVYVIGSDRLSTALHEISETTNRDCCDLELDYTFNDPNDPNRFYYRSDHYNFVENGVPAIFYFSGVHEDYHQPTDTVEKIQFEKMTAIARLIFSTAWALSHTTDPIAVDVIHEQ